MKPRRLGFELQDRYQQCQTPQPFLARRHTGNFQFQSNKVDPARTSTSNGNHTPAPNKENKPPNSACRTPMSASTDNEYRDWLRRHNFQQLLSNQQVYRSVVKVLRMYSGEVTKAIQNLYTEHQQLKLWKNEVADPAIQRNKLIHQEMEAAHDALGSELSEKKQECESLQAVKQDLESQINDIYAPKLKEYESLLRQYGALQQKYSALQKQNHKLRGEVQARSQQLKEHRKLSQRLSAQIDALELNQGSYQHTIQDQHEKIEELNESIIMLEAMLNGNSQNAESGSATRSGSWTSSRSVIQGITSPTKEQRQESVSNLQLEFEQMGEANKRMRDALPGQFRSETMTPFNWNYDDEAPQEHNTLENSAYDHDDPPATAKKPEIANAPTASAPSPAPTANGESNLCVNLSRGSAVSPLMGDAVSSFMGDACSSQSQSETSGHSGPSVMTTVSQYRDIMGITELARKLEAVQTEISSSKRNQDKRSKAWDTMMRKFEAKQSHLEKWTTEVTKSVQHSPLLDKSSQSLQLEQRITTLHSKLLCKLDKQLKEALQSVDWNRTQSPLPQPLDLSELKEGLRSIRSELKELTAFRQHLECEVEHVHKDIAALRTHLDGQESGGKQHNENVSIFDGSLIGEGSECKLNSETFMTSLNEMSLIHPHPVPTPHTHAPPVVHATLLEQVMELKCHRVNEVMISEFVVVLINHLVPASETIFAEMFATVIRIMNCLLHIQLQWLKSKWRSLLSFAPNVNAGKDDACNQQVERILSKYKKQIHRVVLKILQSTLNDVMQELVENKVNRTKLKSKISKLTNKLQQQTHTLSKAQTYEFAQQLKQSLFTPMHLPPIVLVLAVFLIGVLTGYVVLSYVLATPQQATHHPF